MNVSDLIILLTDYLLLISFLCKLGVSGMLLMGFLFVFTDSREDDCFLWCGQRKVAYKKVRIFQLFNIEINNTVDPRF